MSAAAAAAAPDVCARCLLSGHNQEDCAEGSQSRSSFGVLYEEAILQIAQRECERAESAIIVGADGNDKGELDVFVPRCTADELSRIVARLPKSPATRPSIMPTSPFDLVIEAKLSLRDSSIVAKVQKQRDFFRSLCNAAPPGGPFKKVSKYLRDVLDPNFTLTNAFIIVVYNDQRAPDIEKQLGVDYVLHVQQHDAQRLLEAFRRQRVDEIAEAISQYWVVLRMGGEHSTPPFRVHLKESIVDALKKAVRPDLLPHLQAMLVVKDKDGNVLRPSARVVVNTEETPYIVE